ncbi:hypothetical protein ACR9YC_11895 [Parasphingorhabdus sp. DH2-15]|uniref:hypothetical protein n=1 Tax=Parasphingorhabdus sp. DH2-15 TaxID=3444112 RepID=UPI003F682F04
MSEKEQPSDVGLKNDDELSPRERRAKYRSNQNYFSEETSELVRYIGFGLIAASFGLLSTSTDFSNAVKASSSDTLIWSILFGFATILFDYLQMLFGLWSNTNAAINTSGEYKLRRLGKTIRLFQDTFFYTKQAMVLVGVTLLILSIVRAVGV